MAQKVNTVKSKKHNLHKKLAEASFFEKLTEYFLEHTHAIEGEGELIPICEIGGERHDLLCERNSDRLALLASHLLSIAREHLVPHINT